MYLGRVAQYPNESECPSLMRGQMLALVPCLQNPSGNTLYDLSGNNSNGTLTNMEPDTDWVYGINGFRALDFDGTNEYVTSSAPNITSETRDLTASIWFRLNTTGVSQSLFGINATGDDTRRFQAHCPWSDGNVYFDFGGPSGVNRLVISSAVLTTGVLYHFVFYGGSLGLRAYRGGTLVGSSSTAVSRLVSTNGIDIGRMVTSAGSTFFFPGQIPDFRVWNRPLTDNEIMRLAQGGPGYGLRAKKTRVYFGSLGNTRNRSSRFLCFPA